MAEFATVALEADTSRYTASLRCAVEELRWAMQETRLDQAAMHAAYDRRRRARRRRNR